jgi:transcriptional regulator with XRE-family HTH domain
MVNEIAKMLGITIKNAREQKSFTQLELSKKVNISRNYISDIECGRYIPSVEKLLLLSTVLNIDLNILKNDGNTIYK